MSRFLIAVGALAGLLAVALSAYAAHGLSLDPARTRMIDNALTQQGWHALALIAAGILNGLAGERGLSAWQWLYIIEGAITIFVGICVVLILPDFPDTWRALSPQEKHVANRRLAIDAAEADVDEEELLSLHRVEGRRHPARDQVLHPLVDEDVEFRVGVVARHRGRAQRELEQSAHAGPDAAAPPRLRRHGAAVRAVRIVVSASTWSTRAADSSCRVARPEAVS